MRREHIAPIRLFLAPVLLTFVALTACTDSPAGPHPSNGTPTASVVDGGADASGVCSPLMTLPLFADNGALAVGEVVAANDEETLFVTIKTTAGWTLERSQVFAGATGADIPTSGGGNAIPGRFPYKAVHGAGVTRYTFGIPLSSLNPAAPIVIAAHADISLGSRDEGAWADGTPIQPGGSWGTYFEYTAVHCTSERVTTSSGGDIAFDNLTFKVEPNAVSSDVIITAVPVDVSLLSPPSGAPAPIASASTQNLDWNSVIRIPGTGWDMGPDGLAFDVPATITITYDEADLPAGVSEDQLTIFAVNGIFFALPSAVNADNNTVSAQVNHFTTFFIGANPVSVDLAVSRFAEIADPVRLGDQAEYSTDITNHGPDVASGAVVTYAAFGNVAITQLVPGCTQIANPLFGDVAVSCPVNRVIVAGGTEGAPSFLVKAQSVGAITVWASVSPVAGETDPDFSNNRLENTTTIQPAVVADLSVSRFAEIEDPVILGDQAEYSTDVTNNGPDAATGAVVTYTAFGNVSITQLVPGCTVIATPAVGDAAVSCPVNRPIAAGGTEGAPSFLVEALSTGDITVWASVSTVNGEVDVNSANNRLENTTTIVPGSPFSGHVAFVSDRDGTRDLYVKNLATGVVTQLTDDAAVEGNPEWSPDGGRIAYDKSASALGTGDIFVIDANGANETRLTFNQDSFHPTWSPDGSELAYQDRADGDWEILVLNVADPSIKRKLTDNTVQDLEPDWNGGSILFRRSNLVGGSTIHTMNAADGANVIEVVALGGVFLPEFSPDGTRIVYERRTGTAWAIEVLTLGGATVVIENDGVRNTGPEFSPDGTHVIFAKNIDISTQKFHLWVTRADGTSVAQVVETSLGDTFHPSWR